MRRGAFAIALAAAVGLGPLEAVEEWQLFPGVARPGSLRLAWVDVSAHGDGADGVAWAEARSIFEEAGIDVTWRRASAREEARPGEIRVVLVDRVLVDRASRRPVLGTTPLGPRRPGLVWVHGGSVRVVLGIPLRRAAQMLTVAQRRDLGVALGRVVAHEVVHTIVPLVGHGDQLMSSTLTREQLTSAHLSLDRVIAIEVRAALRHGPAPAPAEAELFPAAEGAVRRDVR